MECEGCGCSRLSGYTFSLVRLESSLRTTEEKLQQRTQQLERWVLLPTRDDGRGVVAVSDLLPFSALQHPGDSYRHHRTAASASACSHGTSTTSPVLFFLAPLIFFHLSVPSSSQLLVPNWHGQPSSLSEAVKHATDENPALQTMLHQLMLAVRANSRSQAGAVQVTSTASAAAEALITASPAFVQHTQLSGQLAEVRQDLARGVAPAAVAVVPASAAAAPQPHVGASGAGLLQPVPTSPPRRPGSDPDETPVSSPVRQKSQAAPVTGSASVPPPQTRSSPPPNNHPAPAITSFVLAPSTATEEDSTTAQSPAAQTPSSPAASQPPAGPDPVPDVPAQSSSAALAPPAAAAAPAPVTSPVAASSPGLGASPLATSALPSMYVSTATSYYDNGDDDSDDGDIFSQPNIVPPSLRSSTYQS